MATLTTMYAGEVNSPQTTLDGAHTDSVTTITVIDASVFPTAPNIAVIGNSNSSETVLYTGKTATTLTGVTRGFQGSAAAWGDGEVASRNFTEYDYATLVANVNTLNTDKIEATVTTLSSLVSIGTIATGVWQGTPIAAAYIDSITESQISDLGTAIALVTDNLSVFAATTSLQLKNVISDETGSGALVFATSPSLVTPSLGVATATSLQAIIGNVTPAAGTFTTLAGTTNVVAASDITVTSGSIVSASGAISFDNENLSTTGTLGAGATTVTGLDVTFSGGNSVITIDASDLSTDAQLLFQENNANKFILSWDGGDEDMLFYNYVNSTYALRIDGSTGKWDVDGDVFMADGHGLVVGHTAQLTVASAIPEFQVLGTSDGTDSAMVIGRWGGGSGGRISLVHSRAAIGSNTVTNDGDEIGIINFIADNGTNLNTNGANIKVVHNGTFGTVVPTDMIFSTSSTSAAGVEALRIDSSQDVTFAGDILTSSGDLNITPASRVIIGGSGVRVASGTEGAPAIAWTDDPDTGFWRDTTNEMSLSTGGVEALRIDSSQNLTFEGSATHGAPGASNLTGAYNVWLYTTATFTSGANSYPYPIGYPGFIYQPTAGVDGWIAIVSDYGSASGSANIMLSAGHNNTSQNAGNYIGSEQQGLADSHLTIGKLVGGSTTGGNATKTEFMHFDKDGVATFNFNVHIANGNGLVVGHTAQVATNFTSEVQVIGTGNNDSSMSIQRYSADATAAFLWISKSRGSLGTPGTAVVDNDGIGEIRFTGDDGGDLATSAVAIRAEVDDSSIAANEVGGALVLSTAIGASANDLTEALRIDSSQLVGIGAASGGARLEVVDSGLASSTVLKVTTDDENPYGVIIGNDTFSSSDVEGLALYVNNAGASKVRALGTGAELHLGVVAGSSSVVIDSSQNATFAGYIDNTAAAGGIVIGEKASEWRVKLATDRIAFLNSGNGRAAVTVGGLGVGVDTAQSDGNLAIGATGKLYFDGGSNTYIDETSADILRFVVGANEYFRIDHNTASVVVNEGGSDKDFRIESDSQTHAFFVDAGNNDIGIGTSTPRTFRGGLELGASTHRTVGLHAMASDSMALVLSVDGAAGSVPRFMMENSTTTTGYEVIDMHFDANYIKWQVLSESTGSTQHNIANWGTISGGETVWNDDGIDMDFRVESDNHTHAFFVEGSTGNVWLASGAHLYLDGGGDTYIESATANQIDWWVGGGNDMRLESDGDLHVEGDVIAFSTTISSDLALKENVQTLPNALETINRLRGVSFDWKKENKGSSIGVIAQEVEAIFPELVSTHALNGMKTVNYSALVGVLIEAVKELDAKVGE